MPKITPLDAVILTALAGVIGYVLFKAATGLNYHWKWEVIPQFILRYDEGTGNWRAGLLTEGLITTLRLSVWATGMAIIIGTVVGLFRVSPSLFKRQVATTYVGLIRNTPPLVLIFIFYFFIGDQIMTALDVDGFVRSLSEETKSFLAVFFGPMNRFPQFLSALITLTLFEGAYIAEIVRAGIESIEAGQWEASTALGMRRGQSMRYVILPQAMQRMLPALAGQFISIIKDSAIVSVISIEELTFQAQQIMTTTYRSFEVWTTVLVMYFILTFFCSLLVRKLELALQRN
ncbi:ABC transporter permease subunit [Pseudodesulfovibrio cashew]|uniref:ABC transporter permease subunit n=1 Tax=Pseudodesulfovibrio cashew TaxID=2678688 RepID=A0A6I6JPN1_9BACT|nr:ABC transporter permease subunit [Pseudodesulfovibrio cashew]